jgi:hypothetical protein
MGQDIFPTALFRWAHSNIKGYKQPRRKGVGPWVEKMETPFNANGPGYIPHCIIWAGPFRYNSIPTALLKRSGPMGGKNRYPFNADGPGYIPHHIIQMGPFIFQGIQTALQKRSRPMGGENGYPPSMQMGQDIFPTALFGWAHSDLMAYPQPRRKGVGRWVEQTDTPFNTDGLGYIPPCIIQAGQFRYNCINAAPQKRSGPMGGKNRYPLQCAWAGIYSPLHYSGGPIQI